MKQKIVTKDELWLEFKKAIDYGNFRKFKTRRGFDGFIERELKKHPGKEIAYKFMGDYHVITKCILKIDKGEINEK